MIAVVAGGVGAAKFLQGLIQVVPQESITVIVNVGDDFIHQGLSISPDLDTVTYTLAGAVNPETGWGLAGETRRTMDAFTRYGEEPWFFLGDLDLATHLYRSQKLLEGMPLHLVTKKITTSWGLHINLLPATNDPLSTQITVSSKNIDDKFQHLADKTISFQEYFVGLHHQVPVEKIQFLGAEEANPAPGVLEALHDAETIIIAPSNPFLSIAPIRSIPSIESLLHAYRNKVVAISPVVNGASIKGPTADIFAQFGYDVSVSSVAKLYQDIAATLIVDLQDAELQPQILKQNMLTYCLDTMMVSPKKAKELAQGILDLIHS